MGGVNREPTEAVAAAAPNAIPAEWVTEIPGEGLEGRTGKAEAQPGILAVIATALEEQEETQSAEGEAAGKKAEVTAVDAEPAHLMQDATAGGQQAGAWDAVAVADVMVAVADDAQRSDSPAVGEGEGTLTIVWLWVWVRVRGQKPSSVVICLGVLILLARLRLRTRGRRDLRSWGCSVCRRACWSSR